MVTGSLWALIIPIIASIVGILTLLPVIANMRGNLSGIFSSRLGTGLNLGVIKPKFSERTKDLNKTIISNIIASLFTPIWVSFIVWIFHSVITGSSTSFGSFIIIALSASIFSLTLTIPITILFSFNIFNRGIDPDVLGYPLLSNIADIITVAGIIVGFYVNSLFYDVFLEKFSFIFEFISIFILLSFLIYTFGRSKTRNQFEVFNLLYEIIPVLFFVSIIASLAGIIFNSNIQYTGIILIIPVFMAYTGATASIIGSRYTTAYFLGSLQSEKGRRNVYFIDPLIIFCIGIVLSTLLGLIAYSLSSLLNLTLPNKNLLTYLIICWITGIITTSYSIISSLIIGNIVFKKGIDADNIIVPFSSTTGDLIAILAILLSLFLIG
ncbi:MAG: magnesium transporter [Candidatus Hodarchaeales archaeon]